MRNGHTLLELSVVLSILGLLSGLGVGAWGAQRDRLAVLAIREEAAALLREAPALARVHGGARVQITSPGLMELRTRGDSVLAQLATPSKGVRLEPRGPRTSAELVYGPLGLGRAASLTLDFHRGRVTRSLVISSYGRVRRD
jgi:prepilin-type N-terminal cleavage/methylation domain-containing protein